MPRLPDRVQSGVRRMGRANIGAPGRVAASAAGAANEFARTMGVLGQQMEEIERVESEAQYAEAITKFERDDLAIRDELNKTRRYTPDQLSDWGVDQNPEWKVDPETGEVEAFESMSEIYEQRIQSAYNSAFEGITAPTARGEFGRNVPRVLERIKADVSSQQQRLYLDVLAARHISTAAQHIENGNAELAITSYEAAREAGAMSAQDAQRYIDAAPEQAEAHSWNRVLRGQNPNDMQAAADALRSDEYKGALSEVDRHRFANTLEASADALDSEARKERYQGQVERVLQADVTDLQALITAYKQTGASQRLGLEPTQLAALSSAAETRLDAAERRMRDRSESAAAELVHDQLISYSRGENLDGALERADASYESGEWGAPGSEQAMRAHRLVNNAILAGLGSRAKADALHGSAVAYWASGLAIPADDRDRNDKAQVQFDTLVDNGLSAGDATVKIAQQSKALPTNTQQLFKSAAFSPGHPQVENAAQLFDQIRKQGGADALQFDLTDDEFDRMSYLADTTAAGIPLSNAFDTLERESQKTDKQTADALADWRALQKDDDTSFDSYMEQQLDPGFIGGLFGDQPELGTRAMSEARARAERIYLAYGDANFANARAYDWFRRRYGASTINGMSEFTFHGPETTYGTNIDGTPVITGEEARRQLVEDLTTLGYSGDNLVRVEPSDIDGPNGKPVYAVWVESPETGIVELMPDAWQPDPRRRLEQLQSERTEFFQREREREEVVKRAETVQQSQDPRKEMSSILENLRSLQR